MQCVNLIAVAMSAEVEVAAIDDPQAPSASAQPAAASAGAHPSASVSAAAMGRQRPAARWERVGAAISSSFRQGTLPGLVLLGEG
jgi:hypothetical protein